MAIQKKHYDIEKQGQCDFFDNYRIDYQGDNSILVDNTDGVYHGNIMEFKLNINNTGKVLFQAIKYLSRMRIKGEPIPARILLIDLNATKVYVYNSADYIDDIQKVYVGAASKGNDAFSKNITPVAEYDYMEQTGSQAVLDMLINKVKNSNGSYNGNPIEWYVPIDLDEDCIVGWAEAYYRDIPKATKGDFLGDGTGKINLNGEIRDPKHFAGLINPYTEATNEKFKYLMDCLNDRLNKKDLGAFYTPVPYCQKAAELVEMAVARVPDGNDYIILDRCAGTGNLESALYGRYDKNGDELISHCVVSTYEYYEYKVLLERIGQDVRNIIPPTEANVVYENGKVSNADAMSKDYIDNPLIKQYVDNPKCTIILFENPPYRDDTSGMTGVKASEYTKNNNYVLSEMKKIKGLKTNEMANRFIWSGFTYYLRQNTDSYIVFSPIKYWKADHIVNKNLKKGFIFNRKFFHASPSAVVCALWENIDSTKDRYELEVYDTDGLVTTKIKNQSLLRADKGIALALDATRQVDDKDTSACSKTNGEYNDSTKFTGIDNDNIIGFIMGVGFGLSNPNLNFTLTRLRPEIKNTLGILRKDTYMQQLPILAIKHYLMFERPWYENEFIMCSYDGGNAYLHDKTFLKSCFIFACLDYYNKSLSLYDKDGKYYRNELCFDTTNGDTIASANLKTMALDAESKKLMALWDNILAEAKKTKNYNPKLTYGVYQITKELNTSHEEGTGTSKKTVYDYPNLNGYLTTLRDALKTYYKSHITDKMFKYELLK